MKRFMKHIRLFGLIIGLFIDLVACSNTNQLSEPSVTVPPAINPEMTETSPTPKTTPLSLGAYMLTILPKCDGIQILDNPVKFDWPNIDERLQELSGAQWVYYSCPEPREKVSTFYREWMTKPPSTMIETNWVERSEGSVGVYFNGSTSLWTYLWVVSQPEDAQKSYVIVTQVLGAINCKLEQHFIIRNNSGWETQWSLE
jgi:hypothetical protein